MRIRESIYGPNLNEGFVYSQVYFYSRADYDRRMPVYITEVKEVVSHIKRKNR